MNVTVILVGECQGPLGHLLNSFIIFSDCTANLALPMLSGLPLTCFIPDYCSGIDCCFEVDFLKLTLNAYLYIDSCNSIISGGIENLGFIYNILNYEFGKTFEIINILTTIK